MSKHTPAPWDIEPAKDRIGHRWLIPSSDGAIICYGDVWSGEFIGEGDANARLISAAPDLLEALEVAHMRLCDMICADDGQAWKEAEKAIPKIVAAIAKARGEA